MVREFVHESKYNYPWSSCVRAYFLRYPNPNATHILSVDVIDRRIECRTLSGNQPSLPEASSSAQGSAAETTIPVLCTTRLILKRGTLPKWAPAGLIKNAESWVIEESEVELDLFPPRAGTRKESSPSKSLMGRSKNGRSMRSWSRNLDHTTVLAVSEGLAFKERFGFMHPDDADRHGQGGVVDKGKGRETAATSDAQSGLQWRNFCKTITTAEIESHVGIGMLRRRIEKFGLDRFVAHKDTSQQGILWTRDRLDPLSRPSSSLALVKGKDEALKRASIPEKKLKILESLRPPFLDGYPLGPLQKLRVWWWSGHYSQVKTIRDGYPIANDEDDQDHEHDARRAHRDDKIDEERGERRYRGVPDESVWRNLSGEAGQGVVYSERERTAEGGILNRLRKRLGLPAEAGVGLLARAKQRLGSWTATAASSTASEAQARPSEQERIDSQRAV